MQPAIHHIAYTVPDVAKAVEHWTTVLGAGPFTLYERVPLERVTSNGEPATYLHTAAFGMWGDVPVELVELHEAAPGRVAQAFKSGPPTVHHIAWVVPDVTEASAELEREGLPQYLEAHLGDIHMSFHDASATHGHDIELHRECQALTDFWNEVRAAAAAR